MILASRSADRLIVQVFKLTNFAAHAAVIEAICEIGLATIRLHISIAIFEPPATTVDTGSAPTAHSRNIMSTRPDITVVRSFAGNRRQILVCVSATYIREPGICGLGCTRLEVGLRRRLLQNDTARRSDE